MYRGGAPASTTPDNPSQPPMGNSPPRAYRQTPNALLWITGTQLRDQRGRSEGYPLLSVVVRCYPLLSVVIRCRHPPRPTLVNTIILMPPLVLLMTQPPVPLRFDQGCPISNTYGLISFTYDSLRLCLRYHSGLTGVVQLVILMASLVLPMAGPVYNFGDNLWITLYNLWIPKDNPVYNFVDNLWISCG